MVSMFAWEMKGASVSALLRFFAVRGSKRDLNAIVAHVARVLPHERGDCAALQEFDLTLWGLYLAIGLAQPTEDGGSANRGSRSRLSASDSADARPIVTGPVGQAGNACI